MIPETALSRLLRSFFAAPVLERFLIESEVAPEARELLPKPSAGNYHDEVAHLLVQRRRVDAEFFSYLLEWFPGRVEELSAFKTTWVDPPADREAHAARRHDALATPGWETLAGVR